MPSSFAQTKKKKNSSKQNTHTPALAHALQAHLSAEGAAAEDAGAPSAFDPSLRITCAAAAGPSASLAAPASASSSPRAATIVGRRGGGGGGDSSVSEGGEVVDETEDNDAAKKKKKKTSFFGGLFSKCTTSSSPSAENNKKTSAGGVKGALAAAATTATAASPVVLVSGGRAAAEPALDAGATWRTMLDEVAEECDVVLCCLPGDGPLESAAKAVVNAVVASEKKKKKKQKNDDNGTLTTTTSQQQRRRCFVALGPASRDALSATSKILTSSASSTSSPFDFAAVHLTGDADAVRRGALLAHVAGLQSKTDDDDAASSSSPGAAPPLSAASTAELLLEPVCRDVLHLSTDPAVAGDVAGVSAVLAAGLLEAVAEAAAAADALGIPRGRAHVARLALELCNSSGGAAAARLGPAAAARRMADSTPTSFPAAPADACVSALASAARHGTAAALKARVPTPAASAAVVHWGQVEESGGGHLDVAALASAVRDAAGLS